MGQLSLPARDLDQRELQVLVESIGRDPKRWRGLASFSDRQRHFASLHRDAHVDVWLLCWTETSDTGWHDHDVSAGAVCVVQGTLREARLRIGAEPLTRLLSAGRSFTFGPEHIHRLSGEQDGSISIHAYSPPLCRLGQYTVGAEGVMDRVSVSYTEELRPQAAIVAG